MLRKEWSKAAAVCDRRTTPPSLGLGVSDREGPGSGPGRSERGHARAGTRVRERTRGRQASWTHTYFEILRSTSKEHNSTMQAPRHGTHRCSPRQGIWTAGARRAAGGPQTDGKQTDQPRPCATDQPRPCAMDQPRPRQRSIKKIHAGSTAVA